MALMVFERLSFWRTWIGGAVAVVAAAVTFLAASKTIAPPKEEPREFTIDGDLAMRVSVVRTDLARAASLWSEGGQFDCRVTAFYEVMDSAHFLTVANVTAMDDGRTALSLAVAPAADVTMEGAASFALAA